MYLARSSQTVKIENLATKRLNADSFWLMQRAGEGVAVEVSKKLGNLTGAKVAIVCGSGNNGGDGLVAARHLLKKGIEVSIFSTVPILKWIGDAGRAYSELKKNNPSVKIVDLSQEANWASLESALRSCFLIIDAIFGFGLSRPAEGLEKKIIDAINSSGKMVFSIDVPSGIVADTGQVFGAAIKANKTLAIGIVKPGVYLYPGAKFAGDVSIVDIGLDMSEIESVSNIKTVNISEVKSLMPKREPDVHKKSIGNIGVIAGSVGMTGAAALCVSAAMRSGAGIVTLFAPKSLLPIFENKLTEAIKVPVSEGSSGSISLLAFKQIEPLLSQFDIVIVGPGLSQRPETVTFVRNLVAESEIPMVLDADAINALDGQKQILKERKGQTIITPHPGEFGRLLGYETDEILKDQLKIAEEAAKEMNLTIVLKGPRTIVASHEGSLSVNTTGNDGMATAGTGDVLAGLIGGFWAQGLKQGISPFEAAKLGVFIHGLAGDLAANQLTKYAMIASDLINFLPNAFKSLEKG
jgi:NAD(P)H-hydrate epimerase